MVDSTNPRVMADNIKKLAAIGGGTTVVANPEGAATEALEKLGVGEEIYSIPSIEANPEGAATETLEKLGVDGTILGVPTYTPPAYSSTETLTGRLWIDGSPEYEKVIVLENSLTLTPNTYTEVTGVNFENLKTFTDVTLLKDDGACLKAAGAVINEGKFKVIQTRTSNQVVDIIIVKYVYNSVT